MKSGKEPCRKCPLHSSPNTSRTGCSCNKKYYRASGENASYNCTCKLYGVVCTFIGEAFLRDQSVTGFYVPCAYASLYTKVVSRE